MKRIRQAVAGLVLGVGLSAAWIVGGTFVKDVQFARAQDQVNASRQQIASVQDRSERSLKRDWRRARAFLQREIAEG